MRRLRWIAALAAVAALALTACSGSGKSSPSGTASADSSTASSPLKQGGDLTFLFPTGPVDLDPSTSQDNNVAMPLWNSWFQYLVQNKPDSSDFSPMLASKWTISPDTLSYTFNLDTRAKFSDGSPVTAADVVYSIKRNIAPSVSLLNFLSAKIASILATDASTVVIKLKAAWPHLLDDLASPSAAIYPQAAVVAAGKAATFFDSKPVGSGPFMLSSVVANSSYKVVKNPSYWDAGTAAHLDTITFKIVTDENARVTAVQGGTAQIAQSPPANKVAALKSNGTVKTATFTSARVELIALNTTKPPFNNQAVRQAFSLALDRAAMVKLGLFGLGIPATTFLVPPPASTFQNPSLNLYPTDLAKAKQLVASSGVATPIKFALEVSTGSDQDAILNLAQSSLQQIGFQVTAARKDAASVDNDIIGGKFTANSTFWGDTSSDPATQPLFAIDPSYCCQAYFTGYNDPALVALTRQAVATTDHAAAQKLWDEVQTKVADAAFLLPLYNPDLTYVESKNVQGFRASPFGFYNWANVGYAS